MKELQAQYIATQKQYPDAFVLLRVGDFYEIIGDKAKTAAELLELTLVGRNAEGMRQMVGFPYHTADQYVNQLLEHGDVVVLEPNEEPKLITRNAPKHSERAHALLSASSAHRWLECPPSAGASEAYPDTDTVFTREGTLAHEVAEYVARMVDPRGFYDLGDHLRVRFGCDQEMIDCALKYRDYIQEQTKSGSAVELLEQKVDFSPWVPDGFGTCDCIIIEGDTLTIIDYKYGVGVPVSAVDNPQMKLYALGALNDFGFAYDVAKVEMHIFQPRLDNISRDCITVEELTAWAEKTVKPIAQKAAKGKGDYKPGEHCKFCPHAGRCRALTKLCTEYVETHSLRVAVPVLAPHEVAEVLRLEPLISLWLRRVKEQALTTMLDGGDVPGWKVVEGKQGNRKWTDELTVYKALRSAGYDEDIITEKKLFSPAAMDKVLGKKKAAELLGSFIERATGAPVIAPEADKRPNFNRADDFDALD